MKRKNDYTLKEVIEQLVNAYGMNKKLDEAQLISSWKTVVGGIFNKHTQNLVVKNRILYVNLDSSVIRSELMMARSKLVKMLNEATGKNVIDDIVFR